MLLNTEELARDDDTTPVERSDTDVDSADEIAEVEATRDEETNDEIGSAEELLFIEETKVDTLLETSDEGTEEAELVTEDVNGVEKVELISDAVETREDTLDEAIMEEVPPDVNGDNVELVSEDAEKEE